MAGKKQRDAVREAVAQAGGIEAAVAPGRKAQDPLTGELRRRAVLPLLVLHLINEGPSYGNQLMERIGGMTAGVLSVNPNTMYPLLRQLEGRDLSDLAALHRHLQLHIPVRVRLYVPGGRPGSSAALRRWAGGSARAFRGALRLDFADGTSTLFYSALDAPRT